MVPRVGWNMYQARAAGPTAQRACGVCERQLSKYMCPRCNLPYCCVACYRSHGTGCTEAFAKANMDEHLHGACLSYDYDYTPRAWSARMTRVHAQ